MTYENFVENILLDLDENVSDSAVVRKIEKFVNRGYKEAAKREGLSKEMDLDIVDGVVSRPGGLIDVISVTQNGIPVNFEVFRNYIKVDAQGTVNVLFNYIPDNLEDVDDEPLTNPGNDELIINFAKYLYCMSEYLEDQAAMYKRIVDNFDIVKTNENSVPTFMPIFNIGGM